MNIAKRTYDWMLSWGNSRWGAFALFCFAFAESSFFPIPPDVLLIALCLGAAARSFRFAAICTAGSILGAIAGYGIGFFLWQNTAGEYTALAQFFFDHVFTIEAFERVGALYDRYNFWIVFTAGFTPLPYKLFTVTGGLFHINFAMFLVASVVSRGMRFFLIALLIWKFGAPIKSFIDRYFNLLAVAFTVLLVGSFVLVSYLA
ncbi:YqaA family protein [Alistipes sp.]|uniref:YqaA family protein n=1 Tax=Alistipes sp. TaxID=1872444 RepID=UPI000E9E47A8|nr:YqaA family protein [Alistipes sp.]HBX90922.1 cytochrome B [Alistipes sp.]HCN14280.1 cytochrome B [Alistipes sp.]